MTLSSGFKSHFKSNFFLDPLLLKVDMDQLGFDTSQSAEDADVWNGTEESLNRFKLFARLLNSIIPGITCNVEKLRTGTMDPRVMEQVADEVNTLQNSLLMLQEKYTGEAHVFGTQAGILSNNNVTEGCEQKQEVIQNSLIPWSSGMQDIYCALLSCKISGRWVHLQELADWIDIPKNEALDCVQGLLREGVIRCRHDGYYKVV
ncbi:hypothetical protein BDV33DRAFT_185238 [Aspergillus novoparasiticus]|uniref:Uncharacterized protein n=1 Tax=Aspergillus novoparasiticus TaxID=986946 RepID=A0A5N6E7E0_9EURO|nr:hypothetical protein BDV33DRAFT_185238 [Aspergillus novoparasiticus]